MATAAGGSLNAVIGLLALFNWERVAGAEVLGRGGDISRERRTVETYSELFPFRVVD